MAFAFLLVSCPELASSAQLGCAAIFHCLTQCVLLTADTLENLVIQE